MAARKLPVKPVVLAEKLRAHLVRGLSNHVLIVSLQ